MLNTGRNANGDMVFKFERYYPTIDSLFSGLVDFFIQIAPHKQKKLAKLGDDYVKIAKYCKMLKVKYKKDMKDAELDA